MSEIAQIDCGYLATIQAMADDIWTDPVKNNDLIADVQSALAVLENQSVNFREVTTGTKARTMSLEWLTACNITTQACSDDCTITGSDATPVCKEYELSCLRESTFKVPVRAYRSRTIERQESIAFLMLAHMKELDNYVAQYILTCMLANAGINQFEDGVGDVSGDITYIAPAYWDDSIWGYFNRVIRGNKFRNAYMVTGDNLYQLLFNRRLEAANADGKGNFAKIGTINKIYIDPENVESIIPATTFLVHKTALAFLNKAWYPVGGENAEKLMADQFAYSAQSKNIPGVYYDVITQKTCVSNEYYDAFKIQLHGLCALNPQPCDDDVTGVLAFRCGTLQLN